VIAVGLIAALSIAGPFEAPRLEVTVETSLPPAEAERWRSACAEVAARLGGGRGSWRVRVRRAKSVAAFAKATGRPRFEAAALVGDTIWVQPARIFERLPDAPGVRRHECVHLFLRRAEVPPLPRALEEAVAMGVAGQAARLPAGRKLGAEGLRRANRALERPTSLEQLQTNLQDVVSTLWPGLRAHPGRELLEALKALAGAEDWAEAALRPRQEGLRR